ncbi:hypothetical protein ES708_28100 [subsurface metagenome]
MAEEKPRVQRVLEELYQNEETIRPKAIAEKIGETPLNVGKDLHDLKERGLADTEGEGQWRITDEGRASVEASEPKGTRKKLPPKETAETVPSQADLFKAEGQLIGFGSRKGDIKLDVVVNYVERVANLDDLESIWNALTEMRVANDIKKAWIRLYSQNLPGKEIPVELKAKLEMGTESEKVTEKGGAPRAKRFNVIDGQIIPDDESDYSFSQAIQKAMVEKGASSNQAAEMAATFAKMNTDTMNLLIPLLTKGSGEDSVIKLILTQMGDLQKEIRTASSQGQGSSEVQAISQQLSDLRDTLHNEQLARIQEQNQATSKELLTLIGNLQQQIKGVAEGKQAESKIGLMSKALDKGAEQLSGIRTDLKPLAQSFMERGAAPGEKTPSEKKGFGSGLDKGIERAHEATELENELFFGQGT